MRYSQCHRVLALASLALCASPTLAEVESDTIIESPSVSGISAVVRGHHFMPIYQGEEVTALVAWPETEQPARTSAYLFLPSPAGEWSTEVWQGVSEFQVAHYLRDAFDLDAKSLADRWPTESVDVEGLELITGIPAMPLPLAQGEYVEFPHESIDVRGGGQRLGGALAPQPELRMTITPGSGQPGNPTQPGPDPEPIDDDCLHLQAGPLLDAIAGGFGASLSDPDAVSDVMQDQFNQATGCTCRERTVTLYTSDWALEHCGDWRLDSGPFHNSEFGTCSWNYVRDTTFKKTRVKIHVYPDCTEERCEQTKFKVTEWYDTCYSSAPPSLPPGGNTCGSIPACSPPNTCGEGQNQHTGPWIPVRCPWESP